MIRTVVVLTTVLVIVACSVAKLAASSVALPSSAFPPLSCDLPTGPNIFLACPGDCDGDGSVTISEVVTLVNVVLGTGLPDRCPALADLPNVSHLIQSVIRAQFGCLPVARYRLLEGSTIGYYDRSATPGFQEALSGDFITVDRGFVPQARLLQVTDLGFTAPSISIAPATRGRVGCEEIQFSSEVYVLMDLDLTIDDEPVHVSGYAPLSGCSPIDAYLPPKTLENLQMCGRQGALVRCEDILGGVVGFH